jgi:hypothetical protein
MNLTRILPVLGLSVLFFITSGESLFAQDWILSKLIEKPAEGIYLKGNPEIIDCPYGKAVRFNGESDEIFLHQMPLAGVEQFTIEVVLNLKAGAILNSVFSLWRNPWRPGFARTSRNTKRLVFRRVL